MTAQKTPVYCVYDDSRHSPLALGMIVAHAKSYKGGALMDSYEFIPTPLVSEEVARTITSEYGAGVLLCSNYVWNSSNNLRISRSVKKWHPRSLTIHGGPSVPKYEDACARFLAEHPAVDVTARGEGEVTAAEVLERLAAAGGHDPSNLDPLSDVAGLTFRQYMHGRRPELCRTPDRPRVDDVESLPSPYLSSWFRDDDASNWRAAIVETNRGCPYGCTFCDWGSATLSKIRKFSIERVQGELEWIAQRRVPTVWIADANFGIFDRDVAIAKMLGDMKRQYGYPRQVILTYAKNATERLADIIATLHEAEINSQGVISIQTQDEKTLAVINRSNIKTKRYDELVTIFRERGLPVSSELMVGLPGSTVDSFKADLQFFVNRRVFARVYPTIVLPNSPMAERSYMEKYAIKTNQAGHIVSTSSYTRYDRWVMQRLYMMYALSIGYSVLKYVLYYLQFDRGIKAIDVIERLQAATDATPSKLPRLAALIPTSMEEDGIRKWMRAAIEAATDDWKALYAEVEAFLVEQFGLQDDAGMRTAIEAQMAILPRRDRPVPYTQEVPHDIAAYFEAAWGEADASKSTPRRKLAEYPSSVLQVEDPKNLCGIDIEGLNFHQLSRTLWELKSQLMTNEGVQR